MSRRIHFSGKEPGPLEPHSDRMRRRLARSERLRASAAMPRHEHPDIECWHAALGDYLLAIDLAVTRFILTRDQGDLTAAVHW